MGKGTRPARTAPALVHPHLRHSGQGHWGVGSNDNVPILQVHPDVRLTRKVEQVEGYLSCGSQLRSS